MGEITLTLLQAIAPKSNCVTVHGVPVTEGNAVEMVSALSRRYQGRIVWLVDSEPQHWELKGAYTPVTVVRTRSFRGIYSYLRSEVVFFTHGVFGAVQPSRRQSFVNLWHGDGIKRKPTADQATRSLWPATYVSGGSKVLTARKAYDFKMGRKDAQLVFGNPRIVQFYDPPPQDFLDQIGVGQRSFIIWMPTFRKSSATGVGYEADEVRTLMTQLIGLAKNHNLAVVVKAHRQDAESRGIPGAISVTDSQLADYGVSLYSLLGAAAALVTDYSSVWTDYLQLDRPIGFLIPDAHTYVASRGLYPPDVLEWLPGPTLENPADLTEFLHEVLNPAYDSSTLRVEAKSKLGIVSYDSPADEILDALQTRGCFRKGSLIESSLDLQNRPRLRRRYGHLEEDR